MRLPPRFQPKSFPRISDQDPIAINRDRGAEPLFCGRWRAIERTRQMKGLTPQRAAEKSRDQNGVTDLGGRGSQEIHWWGPAAIVL